jgi:hypothetical protein
VIGAAQPVKVDTSSKIVINNDSRTKNLKQHIKPDSGRTKPSISHSWVMRHVQTASSVHR